MISTIFLQRLYNFSLFGSRFRKNSIIAKRPHRRCTAITNYSGCCVATKLLVVTKYMSNSDGHKGGLLIGAVGGLLVTAIEPITGLSIVATCLAGYAGLQRYGLDAIKRSLMLSTGVDRRDLRTAAREAFQKQTKLESRLRAAESRANHSLKM